MHCAVFVFRRMEVSKESRIPGYIPEMRLNGVSNEVARSAGWARSSRSWGEIGWLLATEHTQPAHHYAKGGCDATYLLSLVR